MSRSLIYIACGVFVAALFLQIVVAWFCAYTFRPAELMESGRAVIVRETRTSADGDEYYWAKRYAAFGAQRVMASHERHWVDPSDLKALRAQYGADIVDEPAGLSRARAEPRINTPAGALPESVIEYLIADSFGWPLRSTETAFRALQYESPYPMLYHTITTRSALGIPIPRDARVRWDIIENARFFPTRVDVFNTLMNAATYSAVLAVPACVMFGMIKGRRRRWRIRSNLCVRCGYPLKGTSASHCPECGWNRPPNEGQRPPQAEPPSAEAPSSPDSFGTQSPPNIPPHSH